MDQKEIYVKGGIVMSKISKIWLIIATSLVFVGALIFVIAMSINDWDFSKLNTVKYETINHTIDEEFKNISIKTTTADIQFAISNDGKCKVVCRERENMKHTVEVKGDTLTIDVDDDRKWSDYIGIIIDSPKITIYLPEEDYTSLVKVKVSTGDIRLDSVSVDNIDFKTSTGDVKLTNVVCKENIKIKVSTGDVKLDDVKCIDLTAEGNTGDVSLKNVIVDGMISVKTHTGDIKFTDCDGSEISMEASTGDIKGSFLTNKIFIAKTNTGDIEVPKTSAGGRCELSTNTGDIKVRIAK